MQTEPEIVFEHMEPSDVVRKRVAHELARLEKFHERITACRVVVEGPSGRRNKGDLYRVRVHLTTPGGQQAAATRSPDENHAHEDVLVAIRDAFNAAQRQLEDTVRQQRGAVKTSNPALRAGRVSKMFADRDYGFLESEDGGEVYFHRNALPGDAFDHLQVGDVVEFKEDLGDEGPRATTVRVAGKAL